MLSLSIYLFIRVSLSVPLLSFSRHGGALGVRLFMNYICTCMCVYKELCVCVENAVSCCLEKKRTSAVMCSLYKGLWFSYLIPRHTPRALLLNLLFSPATFHIYAVLCMDYTYIVYTLCMFVHTDNYHGPLLRVEYESTCLSG